MQTFVNGRYRRFGRAGSVGVLDTQQHLTAVMFGEQPIEKRCASPTNVQKTSRGGRKSCNNRHVNRFQRVSLRSGVALFITSFSHRPTASPACNFFGGTGMEAVVANGAARWRHDAEILNRHGC